MSSTENARKRLSRVLSDLAALDRGSVLDYLLVAIPRAHGRPDTPCQLHVLSSSALEAHRHLLFPTVQSDLLLSTLRSTHPASAAGDNCTSTSARGVLDLLGDDCSSLRWGDDLLADASALTIQLSTTPDDAIPRSLTTLTSTPSHHHSPAIVRSPNQLGMHGGAGGGGGGPPSATQLSTPASCSSAVYATLPGTSEIDDEFLSQAQRVRPAPIYVRSTAEIPEPICARDSDQPEYYPLAISDSAAVTEFLEAKFRELQQLVCKIVAKAWIKVIEPKKQTNHPYNKGEGYKPDWWPSQARHKEPDHLMKPERLLLLISMLRSRKADLRQLRSATLEYSLNIPKNKMEVLEEIYYVADMEERYQRNPSRSDEALIIWTIAPEKLTKSVQAAAAAAVKASSRSMTTIASQMPKSVSPLSPAKRALEEDAYIKAEEPPSQKFCRENSPIQQQQQPPSSLPQSQPQPQPQSQTSHQLPQQSHQQEHQQPLPQHAEQQPQEPPKPQYMSVQVPQHPQERPQFVAVNLNQAADELPQVFPHQQHSGLLEQQHQSQHLPYNSLLVGGGGSRHPSALLPSATPATAEALTGFIPRDSAGGIDNAHQLLYMPRSVMTSASTTPPAFFNANSRRYTTGSIEDSLGQLVQHQQHQQHLAPPSMVPTPEHGTPVYDFVSPPFQQHQQQLQHQQALGQMAAHGGMRRVRQRSMQDTLPRSTIYPALGAGAGAYQGFPDMTGQVPWDKSAHEQPQGHQSAQQEMIINHHDSSLMDADLGSTYAPAFGDEGDLELGQWRECTDNAV
ncbi:hypothetical protein BZA70DRAFT_275596 [Myxozyma melibiosi]|uniref:Subtelomeric hrmA-associated cluster protein AFUB-079030/YDR124W-like helical bundle domain-containing protein n=1 Tax=Myxozyma melibiosi TaxID=54550 RepID=A0ABR1F8G4_9ASCO